MNIIEGILFEIAKFPTNFLSKKKSINIIGPKRIPDHAKHVGINKIPYFRKTKKSFLLNFEIKL